MDLAFQAAKRSKDPSTQVGAYLVDSTNQPLSFGYNGFPRGVADTNARWERPEKYRWVIHGEVNAILNATKAGRPISDSTLYTTLFPCSKCALVLAQSGITTIYYADWKPGEDFELAKEILAECRVDIIELRRYSVGDEFIWTCTDHPSVRKG